MSSFELEISLKFIIIYGNNKCTEVSYRLCGWQDLGEKGAGEVVK